MGIEDNTLLTRYLLGDLPEPDRERLEEQYFTNDEAWESLRAVEHELVDAYVRGDLPPRQREQFESYFLDSSRNRQHLEFARLLLSQELREQAAAGSDKAGEKAGFAERFPFLQRSWRPALKVAFAAAALAAAALALFFAVENRRLKDEFNAWKAHSGSSNKATAAFSPTPYPTAGSRSPETMAQLSPSDSTVLSVLLTPGLVRDGAGGSQVRKLALSDAVRTVVLHLALEEDAYPRYEVVVQSVEGKEIEHLDGLKRRITKSSGPVVAVKLSSQRLAKGDYIVKLSGQNDQGLQEVDSYTFSIIR